MILIFNSRVCIIFNSLNQIHIIKFSSAVFKNTKKNSVYAKKYLINQTRDFLLLKKNWSCDDVVSFFNIIFFLLTNIVYMRDENHAFDSIVLTQSILYYTKSLELVLRRLQNFEITVNFVLHAHSPVIFQRGYCYCRS